MRELQDFLRVNTKFVPYESEIIRILTGDFSFLREDLRNFIGLSLKSPINLSEQNVLEKKREILPRIPLKTHLSLG